MAAGAKWTDKEIIALLDVYSTSVNMMGPWHWIWTMFILVPGHGTVLQNGHLVWTEPLTQSARLQYIRRQNYFVYKSCLLTNVGLLFIVTMIMIPGVINSCSISLFWLTAQWQQRGACAPETSNENAGGKDERDGEMWKPSIITKYIRLHKT